MKISIYGMGYVGVVSAACLLRRGHTVTAVDVLDSKIDDLNAGQTPVREPGVSELLSQGHAAGRLRATTNPADALRGCEMVWICVGTPSLSDGGVNLAAVENVTGQIGRGLRESGDRPLVVLRSTALPGTTRQRLIPLLQETSRLRVGHDVHVVYHPEFLREGSGVKDFERPPKIVVGEAHPAAANRLLGVYDGCDAPRFRLDLEEAELIKYCDNLFHAVKITFANELGAIARAAGVDARRVLEVLCADTQSNISARYLRPGFAFGGSCLPKDLRAILRHAAIESLTVPLLEGATASNAQQIRAFVARVLSHRPKAVGLVGLAFKPGTDDMRESPYVTVAKRLIGEGVRVRIYDPDVDPACLIGSNQKAVQAALGHLEALLVDAWGGLDGSDLIVVNHAIVDADQLVKWLRAGIRVIDLVGVKGMTCETDGYEGIAW